MTDDAALIREAPGMGRCDLSQLLRSAEAFASVVGRLAAPFRSRPVDVVVGIEAAGLPFAAGVALALGAGLSVLRREGGAAWESDSAGCIDYSGREKRFELVVDVVRAGDRVVVVDDWAETGEQLAVARTLVGRRGAEVVGFACVNVDAAARRNPTLSGVPLHSALEYRWSPPGSVGL